MKLDISEIIEDNIVKDPFKLEYNTCNVENAIKQAIKQSIPIILEYLGHCENEDFSGYYEEVIKELGI